MTDFDKTSRLLKRNKSPWSNNNIPLKTSPKIQKIVEDAGLFVKTKQITPKINTTFHKPQTDEDWKKSQN